MKGNMVDMAKMVPFRCIGNIALFFPKVRSQNWNWTFILSNFEKWKDFV